MVPLNIKTLHFTPALHLGVKPRIRRGALSLGCLGNVTSGLCWVVEGDLLQFPEKGGPGPGQDELYETPGRHLFLGLLRVGSASVAVSRLVLLGWRHGWDCVDFHITVLAATNNNDKGSVSGVNASPERNSYLRCWQGKCAIRANGKALFWSET